MAGRRFQLQEHRGCMPFSLGEFGDTDAAQLPRAQEGTASGKTSHVWMEGATGEETGGRRMGNAAAEAVVSGARVAQMAAGDNGSAIEEACEGEAGTLLHHPRASAAASPLRVATAWTTRTLTQAKSASRSPCTTSFSYARQQEARMWRLNEGTKPIRSVASDAL
ncbi:hypothetical protein TraAM80_01976 [Trypanosoma rangeli]|uniref:Uncharacterized protein n=1 Tax=Trypanosoma rangeli TaxID=5698 RepID=A0A3R7NYX4_TRYRA|nr:uncharacterized protein TraAM80_01976 [Trypanosoma rangeli]RNF09924.1 hypothetical protein TraAM80_01976 [Trypanosoma rangeli]|eukprot:RNF09924.1 hypothetical protein TraAM80_01976 [Trypanosoma rangeli]